MKYCLSCLLWASISLATTLLVPGSYPTIQDAVDQASSGDSILVSPGIYPEQVDYLGKTISVIGVSGPLETTVEQVVIEDCGYSGTAVIEGFRFESGYGVYCENSSVRISDCVVFDSNQSGTWCDGCIVEIRGNSFLDGGYYYGGGGIRLENCSGSVANNLIQGNSAGGDYDPGRGGGIYLKDCTDVAIMNNTITGNTVEHSTTPYNFGGYGAGVCTNGCTDVYMINNTVVQNTATGIKSSGGGICLMMSPGLVLLNNIVWDNIATAHYSVALMYGSTASISYSDVQQYYDPAYVSGEGVSFGDGMMSDTPVFTLGTYSGFELNYPDSPGIDDGNPSPEYYDLEDPSNPGYALYPALGTVVNDMGAYGGGGVGYWVALEHETLVPCDFPSITVAPNPCSSAAGISFQLPAPGNATLYLFDIAGRCLDTLAEGYFPAGSHTAVLDGSNLPSGVYICRLLTDTQSDTARLVLLE